MPRYRRAGAFSLLALALLATSAWTAPARPDASPVQAAEPADSHATDGALESDRPRAAQAPTSEQLRRIDAGGLYSLSGIMEVGSQLLLHPDGRFEWMLAYGALDQAAQGRWRREGGRVLLVADLPKGDGSVFVSQPPLAWDEDSERRLRAADSRRATEAALALCPFLRGDDYAMTPAPISDLPPSPAALDRIADDALASVRAATLAMEKAAAEAVAAQSAAAGADSDVDAAMARAKSAVDDYQIALLQLGPAFEQAGRDVPTLPPPRYPEVCEQPSEPHDAAPTPPWRGGHAVVIGDPRQGMHFSGITVVFEFSDGQRVEAVTNLAGWAGVARRGDLELVSIELELPDGSRPAERFVIGSRDSRLYPYSIDSAGLSAPPFETMELRIEGDDLVPTWPDGDERGRYSHD